jgi:hypothetical protein
MTSLNGNESKRGAVKVATKLYHGSFLKGAEGNYFAKKLPPAHFCQLHAGQRAAFVEGFDVDLHELRF